MRVLAASLVNLGRAQEAAGVMQQMLILEPDLTVSRLRQRVRHIDKTALDPYLEALRSAGLPE